MSHTTTITPETGFCKGNYTVISKVPIPNRAHATVAQAILAYKQAHENAPKAPGSLEKTFKDIEKWTALADTLERYQRIAQQFQIQSFTENPQFATV